MFKKLREFFEKAWKWIEALWAKHDDHIEEMVAAIMPMVISMAFRNDLSGDQKKKAIVDAILDGAEEHADRVATSMINEAIEIAANKYNIQIGKVTKETMDNAVDATLEAARSYSNGALKLSGSEAEDANISLTNENLK